MKKLTTAGLTILCAALFVAVAQAEIVAGRSYYTRANIWYENPEKIQSTNYHVGSMLPAGSLVKVIKVDKKGIQFSDEKGKTYTISYIARHSSGTMDSFLSSYFSQENILAGSEYSKLTESEKENIKKGVISEGMSKSAVLLAYGYPPSHKTKSTDLNTWTYWLDARATSVVTFDTDGKVTSVSGAAKTDGPTVQSTETPSPESSTAESTGSDTPEVRSDVKPLTNGDVLSMVNAGLAETTIISVIERSPSVFDVSPAALIELKDKGMAVGIIDAMIKAPQMSKKTVTLRKGAKNILFFEGDTSRAYTVLGEVMYKHDKGVAYGSTLDLSMEGQKIVKDGLKSVAISKYGNKVDAIINLKMGKGIAGGFWGTYGAGFGAKNTLISGSGVAVSYD